MDGLRRKKAMIKAALRSSRANEKYLKADAVVNKLPSKNIISFWKNKKSHDHQKLNLTQKKDQVCGHQNTAG